MTVETTSTITLRYPGHAYAVRLATSMPRFDHDTAFRRAHDGWQLRLALPSAARIEYRIELERRGGLESILDPLNPSIATNPFGRNSVLTGPDYRLPRWPARIPTHPGSRSESRMMSRILGGRRNAQLYRPIGLSDESEAPLLFVFDGSDYATSLHYHIPWLVKSLIRWSLYCAATQRRMRHHVEWMPFFLIADSDAPFEEKLAACAEIADDRYETARFEEFCSKHLGALDEIAWEYFSTDRARTAVERKVAVLFPEHEVERFTDHFWGLSQFWTTTERDRIDSQ